MIPHRRAILPLVFAGGLGALAVLSPVRETPKLLWTFLGVVISLCTWWALLLWRSQVGPRSFVVQVVLRKQHYVQACAQLAVFVYWGWHWSQVRESGHLLLAQLLFAYAFEALLSWSRRDTFILGFGPFPVVFSINLFLWFKPDWFYLQFAMIALGFVAKEFLRWNREGRRVHIFNPSSFPLAVFSLVLLATGMSDVTWGREIATTQFYPPHMYLMLFLIGLPGQLFFGVTTMTMSAVIATYSFGLLYFATTGIYFFYDSYIPIAVFLGMHLLFTDPSTSPRTELGRIAFGVLYGLSTVVLYQGLGSAGLPTFYDKLLQVPILNLSVKGLDRLAGSRFFQMLDPGRIGRALKPLQRHAAYIAIWAAVFIGMSAVQGVGDAHPGQWLPFWRQACDERRPYACPYLADLQVNSCAQGSSWACNEAGLLHLALMQSGEDLRRREAIGAAKLFSQGCDAGSEAACRNLEVMKGSPGEFESEPPKLEDYPIILRGSKGPIQEREPSALYALACREGWRNLC